MVFLQNEKIMKRSHPVLSLRSKWMDQHLRSMCERETVFYANSSCLVSIYIHFQILSTEYFQPIFLKLKPSSLEP